MKLIKFLMALIIIAGFSIIYSAEARATTGADIGYIESNSGGVWQYDFTFGNTSTSEDMYSVFLFLDVSDPITVTGSALPDYWFGTVWEGENTTTYLNAMSTDSSAYIGAYDSPGGFSFTADQQISGFDWHAAFKDGAGDLSTLTGAATNNTPPVVPEPVSTILFITGGAVMAVRKRFRRK